MIGKTISHYRIVKKLGGGGMGVVYKAEDTRLGRLVAMKTIRGASENTEGRKQLWREARSLARVSHPRICQLFDAVEEGEGLFLVMELLEGHSLDRRLAGGPVAAADAVEIIGQILEALEALHTHQIIHRDLKPSNVFLTPHGVKLLDFGLARVATGGVGNGERTQTAATFTTRPGLIAGTPHYMAPEQVQGQEAGMPADIFAAGSILYEMLARRRPFDGASVVDVLYAVAHHNPPPLAGSREVEALDQVIRRALAKRKEDRYGSAREMRMAVGAVPLTAGATAAVERRTVTRLIALPFRVLRKDQDTDFLAYSLPDAISSSLSGADGIIVRSSLVAARFDGPLDPRRIAAEAEVDAILAGTLMRAGEQLRVTCQLVEAPGGAVIWSDSAVAGMEDLFQLQDELSRRIVESLMLPLTEREHRILRHDIPATASAYQYYLRANQVAEVRTPDNMRLARELYTQCLEEDQQYAPAWARLGRIYRFIEKFGEDAEENLTRADDAFRKAFALNPNLPLAHNLYTQIECDRGCALSAMLRLRERARFRRNDADLFAGLVQSCRYCDELKASVAAHQRARHLDSHIVTSVSHTYFVLGDYQKTIESYGSPKGGYYLDCAALVMLGEKEEALARLRARERSGGATGSVRAIMQSLRAYLEGDREGSLTAIEAGEQMTRRDPESLFYEARHLAQIAEAARALDVLSLVVDGGFLCASSLSRDAWLAPLQSFPGYSTLVMRTDQQRARTHASFVAAGGPELLNMT